MVALRVLSNYGLTGFEGLRQFVVAVVNVRLAPAVVVALMVKRICRAQTNRGQNQYCKYCTRNETGRPVNDKHRTSLISHAKTLPNF
jgi:hypothetical protein